MVESRFKKGCITVFKDFPYLVYFILAYGAAIPRLLLRKIKNGLCWGPNKVKNKRWLSIWWSNWSTKVRPFMLTSMSRQLSDQ